MFPETLGAGVEEAGSGKRQRGSVANGLNLLLRSRCFQPLFPEDRRSASVEGRRGALGTEKPGKCCPLAFVPTKWGSFSRPLLSGLFMVVLVIVT